MPFESEFYSNSEILPRLTPFKIHEILVVSSLYNYFSMEEGGLLASQIVNEYKGLRLENPPRITGVYSAPEALQAIADDDYDMVLIIPHLENVDPFELGFELKKIRPATPVILLSQNTRQINSLMENPNTGGIDHKYMDKYKSRLRKRNCKFLTDACQYIIQLSFQKFKSFISRC
ncbi:hypothetical protein [Desulfobacter postgatei]|jgi:hypothetical protein|uniref:hypothetical protein n=1 Tax=Desulfobacter postgatei TaxID=2293 RepID=UPI000232AEF8|nr:hypothetical protein [Desulfobacter postgatei]